MRLDLYAIYSIWLREMLRFFRLRSRLIGSIGASFFFLAFMGAGFNSGGSMAGLPQGVDYINFLTPGIIGMTLLFSSTFTGLSVLWDREFGFLKEIMVAPVSRAGHYPGPDRWGSRYSHHPKHGDLDLWTGHWHEGQRLGSIYFLLCLYVVDSSHLHGMGLAFASKMKDMSGFSLIMNFLIFPLFFLSGAVFPLSRLPSAVRVISYLDPRPMGWMGSDIASWGPARCLLCWI